MLATALAEKIHLHYPEASIDFLLRKGNEGLLMNHPFLHEVLVWSKKENKYLNLLKILRQIRRNKYDTVINVQRFAATGFLTAFSGATEKTGFSKNPFSFLFTKRVKHLLGTATNPVHEISRNQELIKHFTGQEPALPRLYPSEADYKKAEPLKKEPYIVIAPASVWFTKQFPVQKWIDFIHMLPPELMIYLIGATNDTDLCSQIADNCPGRRIVNLCGQHSFLETAALQQHALMNYTNDSAPLHFASAVNAPVTAVYCSTLPSFGFRPLSQKSFIVQSTKEISCRPCGLHGKKKCPEGHFNCALTIATEQLLATLPAASAV